MEGRQTSDASVLVSHFPSERRTRGSSVAEHGSLGNAATPRWIRLSTSETAIRSRLRSDQADSPREGPNQSSLGRRMPGEKGVYEGLQGWRLGAGSASGKSQGDPIRAGATIPAGWPSPAAYSPTSRPRQVSSRICFSCRLRENDSVGVSGTFSGVAGLTESPLLQTDILRQSSSRSHMVVCRRICKKSVEIESSISFRAPRLT
jgi:hypothetical protein